jgi:hypothetical protein
MPAFVKSRFGEFGNKGEEGTIRCVLEEKNSKNECRISEEVIIVEEFIFFKWAVLLNKSCFDKGFYRIVVTGELV